MAYTALLDACVLYPNMLRDLLLRLAVTDLYRAKWSADIHDEWMRSLAANRPDIPPEHITRVRNLMDENVRDALVEDYASLVPGLTLPDPKDRHVLAAAIVGRADVIVTFNLREFPADLPSASRLSTRTNSCATSSTWRRIWVCAVVRELRTGLRNPPRSVDGYLATLEKHDLIDFAAALRSRTPAI